MAFGHSLRSFFPSLLTLARLTVLLGLGAWQVERLVWKEDLLARMAERRTASPRPSCAHARSRMGQARRMQTIRDTYVWCMPCM